MLILISSLHILKNVFYCTLRDIVGTMQAVLIDTCDMFNLLISRVWQEDHNMCMDFVSSLAHAFVEARGIQRVLSLAELFCFLCFDYIHWSQ